MKKNIAFLGIGLMGFPMAQNILAAKHNLKAWNRDKKKADLLHPHGAMVCDTVTEAVTNADMVISMVSDGAVVKKLITDVKDTLNSDTLWIDMSSTKPDEAKENANMLSELGIGFMDAPVSGGTKGAKDAILAIMVGGNTKDFTVAEPLLSTMGRPVHVGGVGSGQLAKLANQMIVADTISAVAEAMLLLEKGGANTDAVRDALKGGFADSKILQQHGARMTKRDFAPGGLSRLQLKDLDNALDEAGKAGLTLPTTQQVRDRFSRYCHDLGGSEKDHSGLFEELLDLNPS